MAKRVGSAWMGSAEMVRPSPVGAARTLPRPRLKALAWLFVLGHLFFAEVAGLSYIYLPHAWDESPPGVLVPSASLLYRALVGLWAHWDGRWYLAIAQHGYPVTDNLATAFFPLYPLALHFLGGASALGGVLLSLAAMAYFYWMFYALVAEDLGERIAWYTMAALAFFPTAFYTQAVYSEPLFLALAVTTFYWLRRERWWLAALFAVLSSLVTMYGILLAVPLAWRIWRKHGLRLRRFGPVLAVPSGIVGYVIFLTIRYHYPLVFEAAQRKGWGRAFAFFGQSLVEGAVTAYQALGSAFSPGTLFAGGSPQPIAMNFYDFAFAVFAVIILLLSLRWLAADLWMYAALAVIVPLSYPAQGNPLMSFPRLVLEAFPLFIGLGVLLSRSVRFRQVYFAGALIVGALFVALFATSHWVA